MDASVDLRSTRMLVDRSPVGRAASGADAAFRDRGIEMCEHVEEAMIGKEARAVEEVGLREEADARTETVHDTVPKTEDERTGEVRRVRGCTTGTPSEGSVGSTSGGPSPASPPPPPCAPPRGPARPSVDAA